MKKQLRNDFYNKISTSLDEETYDVLLTNVNEVLYDYSEHHTANRKTLKKILKEMFLNNFFFYLKTIFTIKKTGKKIILSNAYVRLNFEDSVTLLPPWSFSLRRNTIFSWKMILIVRKINKEFKKNSVKVLISSNFKQLLDGFKLELSEMFVDKKIGALIVANDLGLFENLSIRTANKLGIPSFVYLHGLPARYNDIDDNRADFLIVWGVGIKEAYVDNGVPEKKILTLKHPLYSTFDSVNLQSNLNNVLVLSKAISGTPCISTELVLPNRAVILYYLELVKENLIKLGVSKARLRLHPSENKDFYSKNLPDDFFTIDNSSQKKALSKSSLIVGPTSTMVLDAIKTGRNYILFDPIFDGLTLEGMPLVEPFTGNSFIKLSNSLEDMKRHIESPSQNIDFKKLNQFFSTIELDSQKFLDLINQKI